MTKDEATKWANDASVLLAHDWQPHKGFGLFRPATVRCHYCEQIRAAHSKQDATARICPNRLLLLREQISASQDALRSEVLDLKAENAYLDTYRAERERANTASILLLTKTVARVPVRFAIGNRQVKHRSRRQVTAVGGRERMRKLSNKDIARRDEIVAALLAADKAHGEAIKAFNVAQAEARAKLTKPTDTLNGLIEQWNEWCSDLCSVATDWHDERSEAWQESEKGEAYREWISAYDNASLEEVESPEVEDLDAEGIDTELITENLPDGPEAD